MIDDQKNIHEDDDEPKSKSQLKREMLALQEVGKTLLALKPAHVKLLPLSAQLLAAIEESYRITQNEAKRRHLQYIGKLMRNEDIESIQNELDKLDADSTVNRQYFHNLEKIRDMLTNEKTDLNTYCAKLLERYPNLEIQTIRQLTRNHFKEIKESKPPASSRKLFKYLRENISL